MLPARHDDDDDDQLRNHIYIHLTVGKQMTDVISNCLSFIVILENI